MTDSIKTQIAKKVAKTKQGFTLASLMAAFNSGLGIRKLDWEDGYFVYMNNGVVMNGNLKERDRDDKPRADALSFGADMSVWEIVDKNYVLKRDLIAKISKLHNIKDGALIAALARTGKVTIP